MRTPRVAIVGGGVGGLVAALSLSRQGVAVTVCERAAYPGGKMRTVEVGGLDIDSGPTVLTMRDVFDEIFAEAGASFAEMVPTRPLDVLARHAWSDGSGLDLFADAERSRDAVAAFAGPREAARFVAFSERARRIRQTLESTYIRQSRPSLPALVGRIGAARLSALAGISPFTTLWRALEGHFGDPRLRQLFGRYATYCGSSPYLAPATLMLVASVEQEGVWVVEGGMSRIAHALRDLAETHGARFRFGTEVARIRLGPGGADGIVLADGETIEADAVVMNGDVAALGAGLLGPEMVAAASIPDPREHSLSAVTFSMVGEPSGFPLTHHNVFFSDDYRAEFDAIAHGRVPSEPTVYVCAQDRIQDRVQDRVQDRAAAAETRPPGPERLFCIVNAPANGDRHTYDQPEKALCETRTFRLLERCGLRVRPQPGSCAITTPADFARLFPGTGGALYGRASHGWTASFQRPGSTSRIPRLYLAGGSVHPGPGVPMAAISGSLAAARLVSDLASTSLSRRAATRGGTSTR